MEHVVEADEEDGELEVDEARRKRMRAASGKIPMNSLVPSDDESDDEEDEVVVVSGDSALDLNPAVSDGDVVHKSNIVEAPNDTVSKAGAE